MCQQVNKTNQKNNELCINEATRQKKKKKKYKIVSYKSVHLVAVKRFISHHIQSDSDIGKANHHSHPIILIHTTISLK